MYFQKIFYALFKAFDDEKLPIIDCVLLNTCRCSVFRAQSYLIPTLLRSVCSTQRALNFRMLKIYCYIFCMQKLCPLVIIQLRTIFRCRKTSLELQEPNN